MSHAPYYLSFMQDMEWKLKTNLPAIQHVCHVIRCAIGLPAVFCLCMYVCMYVVVSPSNWWWWPHLWLTGLVCLHVACSSGFSFSSFVCGLNCMVVFSSHDSSWDLTSPSDPIGSNSFPSFDRNFHVLQWHLQAVFEMHLGSTYWAFPHKQFTIRQPLWEMIIAHAWDMSCPSDLHFTQQGVYARHTCAQ